MTTLRNICNRKSGYSLIELAIVIVIVAVLALGIVSGTALIERARVRSIIAESDSFLNSVQFFEDKYQALPGDFTDAFNNWGTSCAATATICNGNGDGKISYSSSGTTAVESFRAWQHLQLAGIIQGQYTGVATVAGQGDIGVNVPSSNYNSKAGWSFNYVNTYAPPSGYGQFLEIGAKSAGAQPVAALLNAATAYSIDKKLDDGFPNNGYIMADGTASATGCYNNATITATYNSPVSGATCALRFIFRKF